MAFRVIARLDVKPPNLVKGVQMEGLRRLGDPGEFAQRYYAQGADEVNYHDIVASLYERNMIGDLVSRTASEVFVPITVGGGIRTLADARALTRQGADKVCINTAAVRHAELLTEVAAVLGRQAVVLGIEAKLMAGRWEALTDGGRERTHLDVLDWVERAEDLGVGEILLTSIDRDGTRTGFDTDLIRQVRARTRLPLIAHGGAAHPDDAVLAHDAGADAVAIATALHYGECTVSEVKSALTARGVEVRP